MASYPQADALPGTVLPRANPAFVADIGGLDRGRWNLLNENCAAARHEFVQAMDAVHKTDSRYCVIVSASRYRCIARLSFDSAYGRSLGFLLFGRAAATLQRLGLRIGDAVVCGWPLGRGRNVLLDPGVPNELRGEILHGFCEALEAAAGDELLVFPDILPDDAALAHVLEARGYSVAAGLPTARLDLEWNDLDGYLTALKRWSRNSYNAARNEINRYRRSGAAIERLPAGADEWDRICALLNSHHERLNGKSADHTTAKFRQLRQALGEDLLVYVSRQAGAITGVATGVRHGTEAILSWIGIDHETAGRNFTYFNLAYYGWMDDLCKLGVRRVWLGNAAYDAKIRRGCRILPTRMYLRSPGVAARLAHVPLLKLQRAWYAYKFGRYLGTAQ